MQWYIACEKFVALYSGLMVVGRQVGKRNAKIYKICCISKYLTFRYVWAGIVFFRNFNAFSYVFSGENYCKAVL